MTAADVQTIAPTSIAERIKIIDADSHVTEVPDLWSARLKNEGWEQLVPTVKLHEAKNKYRWSIAGHWASGVADLAFSGWTEFPPSYPPSLEQADPASWDPSARLATMDDYGVHAQVLYPNVLGFASVFFLDMEVELRNWCVATYNDFIVEFASTDPNRLIPLMWLPFWDTELCVREMERCIRRGHKGVIFPSNFAPIGYPVLPEEHWYPVWEAAQHHEMSINFHSGFQTTPDEARKSLGAGVSRANFTKECALLMMGNARTIADVALFGICNKFPRVNFVSVESGYGWMPFFAELLDWQWLNSGAKDAHPDYDLLPSDIIRRQVYGTFWFEHIGTVDESFVQNAMFSTDFPHPTSLTPGPKSYAEHPRLAIEHNLGGLSEPTLKALLHDNAARLYHID